MKKKLTGKRLRKSAVSLALSMAMVCSTGAPAFAAGPVSNKAVNEAVKRATEGLSFSVGGAAYENGASIPWGATVKVEGTTDESTYSWKQDGEAIEGEESSIDISGKETVGHTYTVTKTSEDGETTSEASFTVGKKEVKKLSFSDEKQTYDGKSHELSIKKIDGLDFSEEEFGTVIPEYSEDTVNAGTVTVTAGVNNKYYEGTAAGSYEIERASLTGKSPEVSVSGDFTYTGEPVVPGKSSVTVKVNGQILRDKDYTVEWSDNTKTTDTPKAVITGAEGGNYADSSEQVEVSGFKISAKADESLTADQTADLTYTGSALTPVLNVMSGDKELSGDTDYTVTYHKGETAEGDTVEPEELINAGTYTAQITGTGDYEGSKGSVTFTIAPKKVGEMTVKLEDESQDITYDGTEKKPGIKVTYEDGEEKTLEAADFSVEYKNNVNAAQADAEAAPTAAVTVGGGNYEYTGSDPLEVKYTIEACDISSYKVAFAEGAETSFVYNGKAQAPAAKDIIVKEGDDSTPLTSDDFTVKPEELKGTKAENGIKAVVEGAGNYKGTVAGETAEALTYNIIQKSISDVSIEGIQDKYRQKDDGSAIDEPEVVVKDGDTELVLDTDYTLEYQTEDGTKLENGAADLKNAGQYKLVITAKEGGNYKDSAEKSFEITAAVDISDEAVKGEVTTSYIYDGTAKKPAAEDIKLTDGKGSVIPKDAYRIRSYKNTTKAGDNASVTVEILDSCADYKGTKEIKFTIAPQDISENYSDKVTGLDAVTYNGSGQTPTVEVMGLTEEDYTVILNSGIEMLNAQTYDVEINGIGNYTGTIKKTFTVNPANAAGKLTVPYMLEDQVYTGSEIKPDVNLSAINEEDESTYPSVNRYADNVNTGMAVVYTDAVGNYTGTFVTVFKITAKDLRDAKITAADQTYTGGELKPAVTVTDGSRVLKAGTDYDTAYTGNINAGTAKVTVTGKGNYKGTAEKTFKISAKSIAGAKVTAADKTYTGKNLTTSVTVKDGSRTLKSGTDYTLSYKNNKNPGTATVTVTGKGNYAGSVSKTFKITVKVSKASLTSAKKTSKKGQLKIKWKKVSGATGYQVYAAQNKGFTKKVKKATIKSGKTASTTLKGLTKKKTYYVRIRATKKIAGKTYYGAWSTVKKTKTK